jgi:hypothetical protein
MGGRWAQKEEPLLQDVADASATEDRVERRKAIVARCTCQYTCTRHMYPYIDLYILNYQVNAVSLLAYMQSCMHLYVCTYMCTCVSCLHIVYTYIHMYVRIIHTYVRAYHTYIHTYVRIILTYRRYLRLQALLAVADSNRRLLASSLQVICVCMHVCIYMQVICVCIHVCMYICMCACMYVHTYVSG